MGTIYFTEVANINAGGESVAIVVGQTAEPTGSADLTIKFQVKSGSTTSSAVASSLIITTSSAVSAPIFRVNISSGIAGDVVTVFTATDSGYLANVVTASVTMTNTDAANGFVLVTFPTLTPGTRYAKASVNGGATVVLTGTTFDITSGVATTLRIVTQYPIVGNKPDFNVFWSNDADVVAGNTLTQQIATDVGFTAIVATRTLLATSTALTTLQVTGAYSSLANNDYYTRIRRGVDNWSAVESFNVDNTVAETISVTTLGTDSTPDLLLTAGGSAFTAGENLTIQESTDITFLTGVTTQTPTATAGATNTYTWPTALSLGVHYFRFRRGTEGFSNIAAKAIETPITFGGAGSGVAYSGGFNANIASGTLTPTNSTAAANRQVIVFVDVDGSAVAPSAVTLNGSSITMTLASTTGLSVVHRLYYAIVPWPTGTTLSLVGTLGANSQNHRGIMQVVYGDNISVEAVSIKSPSVTSVATSYAESLSVTTTDGGVALLYLGCYSNSGTGYASDATWTNATEIIDTGTLNRNGTFGRVASATTATVTATMNMTGDTTQFNSLSGLIALKLKGTP